MVPLNYMSGARGSGQALHKVQGQSIPLIEYMKLLLFIFKSALQCGPITLYNQSASDTSVIVNLPLLQLQYLACHERNAIWILMCNALHKHLSMSSRVQHLPCCKTFPHQAEIIRLMDTLLAPLIGQTELRNICSQKYLSKMQ